jgi:hypothetical protein
MFSSFRPQKLKGCRFLFSEGKRSNLWTCLIGRWILPLWNPCLCKTLPPGATLAFGGAFSSQCCWIIQDKRRPHLSNISLWTPLSCSCKYFDQFLALDKSPRSFHVSLTRKVFARYVRKLISYTRQSAWT